MKKINIVALLFLFAVMLSSVYKVHAQFQSFNASANSPESYQCFDSSGHSTDLAAGTTPNAEGNFICPDGKIAQLKPYTLQQVEVWFVRILYVIWGLVASLSFLFLVKLGYEYTISRGDVTKITEIRKRIVNYIIGFALVFLAVPILTTVFRLLGINDAVDCYNVNMPGFQFFYTTLCTDPRALANPCDLQDFANGGAAGKVCPTIGEVKGCPTASFPIICYVCRDADGAGVWERGSLFGGGCTP